MRKTTMKQLKKNISMIKKNYSKSAAKLFTGLNTDEEGVTIGKIKYSYEELFFADYENNGFKENYLAYVIYVLCDALTDRDQKQKPYWASLNTFAEQIYDTKETAEKEIQELNEIVKNNNFENEFSIENAIKIAVNIPTLGLANGNDIAPMLVWLLHLYYEDKGRFFRNIILTFSEITCRFFDLYKPDEDSFDLKETLPLENNIKNVPGKLYTNISYYAYHKAMIFFLSLDNLGMPVLDIVKSRRTDTCATEAAKYLADKTKLFAVSTASIQRCLGTDSFCTYAKEGDFGALIRYLNKDIVINFGETKDFAILPEVGISVLLSACKKQHIEIKELEPDQLAIYSLYSILTGIRKALHSEISISLWNVFSECKGDLEKVAKERDECTEEIKTLRKEQKKNNQLLSELQTKENAARNKLKEATDKLEALTKNTKDENIKPEELEKKDSYIRELEESNRRMLSDLQSLSERLKELNEYNDELHEQLKNEKEDIEIATTMQEKISYINQHKVLIVGGRYDYEKRLEALGLKTLKFTLDEADVIRHKVKDIDIYVVCTRFIKHCIENGAESAYSNIRKVYFNNVNLAMLIDCIYEELKGEAA